MKTGVVIGRFQIYSLHAGHMNLLKQAEAENDHLVILIGNSPVCFTDKNPIPAENRKMMLKRKFPKADVLTLDDNISDVNWSDALDGILGIYTNVTLYGSRDSFIPYYKGKYPVKEITARQNCKSATEHRKLIAENSYDNGYFRAGIIHAVENRFPTAYPTVDIAVLRLISDGRPHPLLSQSITQILLARKAGMTKYQFIGGFVDPTDKTMVAAAWRELDEEVKNMDTHELEYVGSAKIDDWRYRGTKDGIITTLFKTYMLAGNPIPADDIEELKWFDVKDFDMNILSEPHHILFKML